MALNGAKLPLPVYSHDLVSLNYDESVRTLAFRTLPVSFTAGILHGQLLVDPCAEEEAVVDDLVTIVLDEHHRVVQLNQVSHDLFCCFRGKHTGTEVSGQPRLNHRHLEPNIRGCLCANDRYTQDTSIIVILHQVTSGR